ncbi:MAG: hypothetical protein JNK87_28285 [Bryobacterales bacterium]|nr:hypothetical protein [Bryobacterales bacterium]
MSRFVWLALFATLGWAQDGPWNHRVLLAVSEDGLRWTVQPQVLAEKASVPELFVDPQGRPIVLFVDASGPQERVGAIQRNADGVWARVVTNLQQVDPNVVRLTGGGYRAYVKANNQGAIGAYESRDGLNWSPLGQVFADARYANATDPDVFETPEGWVMLLSLGARMLRCTSADGLRFETDGTVLELGGSVSDTVKVAGGWRTYFHVNGNPQMGTRMRIRSAFTADGRTWRVEEGDRVVAPASGPAALGVADPAPVQLADGTWLMAVKSFISAATTGPGPGTGPVNPQLPVFAGGIETHFVASAVSEDGLTWTREPGVRLTRASVPAVINDNDERVLLYYVRPPDQPGQTENVAVAVSTDGTNFAPDPAFRIAGMRTRKAVDPSILRDDDGRFRLYYLASDHQGDPAAGPNPHAINMAVSDDGIRFEETGTAFQYDDLVDPDVFRVKDEWLMYVFAGRQGTVIARSADGLQFEFVGTMQPPGWGTTAPITLPDGTLRLYAFDQRTPLGNMVRSFTSADGIHWTQEEGVRMQAAPDEQITDPFVIRWRAGYRMYFKITPAARRFATGQPADVVLGAKGFNDSGGATLFNHPSGLATDGRSLLMTDRWNNRVLVWRMAPAGNVAPDLVLGQPDFSSNNSGNGRGQLNFPGNVAITPDGRRIAVTDTNNDRVLLWNEFPASNGVPADVVIDLAVLSPQPVPGQVRWSWPWGVWTDGRKFAVVATQGASVLIWNSIPVRDNQPPDLVLRPEGAGTPRNITSDGSTFFALSDHNNGTANRPGTMVWNEFPARADQAPAFTIPEWYKGTVLEDGKVILAGNQTIGIWNRKPTAAGAAADVTLRPSGYRNGDGPDTVVAQGRLYVSNYNGNNVLGWNTVPGSNVAPDFSLGSDRPDQDTWAENNFIQNPALAIDRGSLFASSDFERKVFVWRRVPDQSSVAPDAVVTLPDAPWDSAANDGRLVAAGKRSVFFWRNLPLQSERPDVTFNGRIGGVAFQELTGVALDARYFYLADRMANRIYVWEGVPEAGADPKAVLTMQGPGRLSSDGGWLVAASFEGNEVVAWPVQAIAGGVAQGVRIGGPGMFNLPGEALVAGGRFFVADRGNNRVVVWSRLQDALEGRAPETFLGAADANDRRAGLSATKLFMPGSLAWDGSNLWVGEFKFSTRILRFAPSGR